MSKEEVVPQLAANMSAAFKEVWKIIGAVERPSACFGLQSGC
jgi:hypothetical protein